MNQVLYKMLTQPEISGGGDGNSGVGDKKNERVLRLMFETIAIRGRPGSGKDTVAKLLASLFYDRGIWSSTRKFATPIREEVEKLTGVPVDVSETTEGKNIEVVYKGEKMTVGRCLQVVGSERKRDSGDPCYWIKRLFKNFREHEVVIISDVRFPLEQDAVRERKGLIIMINTSRELDPDTMAGRDSKHESETALDGIPADLTIENNGTIEDLQAKLTELVDSFFA